MSYEQLKLKNQVCFPLYAASRLITRAYQPFLDELGITYPQYLVLLVLWEHDVLGVHEIAEKLILNTNTLTPLLKRMEQGALILRERSKEDERKVTVTLSQKGRELQEQAAGIPEKVFGLMDKKSVSYDEVVQLKMILDKMIIDFKEGEK